MPHSEEEYKSQAFPSKKRSTKQKVNDSLKAYGKFVNSDKKHDPQHAKKERRSERKDYQAAGAISGDVKRGMKKIIQL